MIDDAKDSPDGVCPTKDSEAVPASLSVPQPSLPEPSLPEPRWIDTPDSSLEAPLVAPAEWTYFSRSDQRRSASTAIAIPEREQAPEIRQQPAAPAARPPVPAPAQPSRRNWLSRWLFPEPASADNRRASRVPAPGLVAHFWTGGAPQSQLVRDVSETGLYVVTNERWYLGTEIRVTLTRVGDSSSNGPRTLTVRAVAVRHGEDGVGLAFFPLESRNAQRSSSSPLDGADAQQLLQFIRGLQL